MKLAQYLARSGLGSRRKMEELVKSGRVTLNGDVCTDQSREVGAGSVSLDGHEIKPAELVYFAWHKPKGVTTTFSDPHAEETLAEALPAELKKYPLFAVGRLDRDTEGLLILTTDGEWAERLIHPRNATQKVYEAEVLSELPEVALARLRSGVTLTDGTIVPLSVKPLGLRDGREWIELTLTEGRNRIVRRLLEEVGLPLGRLIRTRIAGYTLGGLEPGEYRALEGGTSDE